MLLMCVGSLFLVIINDFLFIRNHQVETISAAIIKSSITDLKSHSISSIAAISGDQSLPSSPALPMKTRSFDDRECLRTAIAIVSATTGDPNASCCRGVDYKKSNEETRKSSENISLHCEINEPNTNIRHESISETSEANANENASDTNLESSSCLSDGGGGGVGKVHSETIALSASPPTITVICAPCTDDILAETAAQQQTEHPIDFDAASDSEETAQTSKTIESQPIVVTPCAENDPGGTDVDADASSSSSKHPAGVHIQLTLEVKKQNDDIAIQQQDDLSPSMDEYQECNPTSGDYQYDIITGEVLVPGCVAPAPTPAPLIAPLAEIEIDPPDDEMPAPGIEKQQSPEATIKTEPIVHSGDIESTAKTSQHQQSAAAAAAHQHQSHTSHAKKKKQKSTDKGTMTKLLSILN